MFRAYVEQRLATVTEDPKYAFSSVFPPLYKYRAVSQYAVNDVCNGQMTITRVGEFKDLFDGTVHTYGTKECCAKEGEEAQEDALANLSEMKRLLKFAKERSIPTSVMVPAIGEYKLMKRPIEFHTLMHFLGSNFTRPEKMRYYYVVHDELMDLLEKNG